MTSLLQKGAGWFVVLAWLLFALTILAFLAIGIGSAINAFYHPEHEWANYDRAENRLLQVAVGVGLCAALASSLALAAGWRTLASGAVVLCWIPLVAGGILYLGSIEKGPQFFDRYAGQQHFRIPWQYGPSGSDKPTPNGITLFLCLDSLLGRYEASCKLSPQNHQVSIYPPTLMGGSLENSWQRRPNLWKSAGVENRHQVYVETFPADGNGKELSLYLFRLTNAEGSLLRSVSRDDSGRCEHYVMFDRYVLFYTAPKSAFPEWEAMDGKLRGLVDSWAVP